MKQTLLAVCGALLLVSGALRADDQKDVLAVLENWKLGTLHKDPALLAKVFHDDLTYTHSSGLEQTKADNLKAIGEPRFNTVKIEIIHPTVRIYGDTAIVKCDADVTNGGSATSHLILLHVFVKTPQGWQMVARQATKKEK